MYRWRDDAFNSVSRSVATHTIPPDTTVLDCSAVESVGIGPDGKDGNDTSIGGFGGSSIDTVGSGRFGTEYCTVGNGGRDTNCCLCRRERWKRSLDDYDRCRDRLLKVRVQGV